MKLGMVGLGRMGLNMTRRLLRNGHRVVVFNKSKDRVKEAVKSGAVAASSLRDLVKKLSRPRVVWFMLPAGTVTDDCIEKLVYVMSKGDIIVEGGNSYYKDDIRRAAELKKEGIHYIDAGVSGGVWGLKNGYCIMAGGEKKVFKQIEPAVKTLAPKNGYLYCGATGAGHFVKMIHNAIEYAMMESYAEGFQILKASKYGSGLSLENVASMWNNGSVIRSWLLELLIESFREDPELKKIQGYVEDSGEARFTVKEAVDSGVAADVIAASLFKRFNSRQEDVFANRVLAALRNKFGGHAVARAGAKARVKGVSAGSVTHAAPDKKRKAGRPNGCNIE
ncbi:MAG TPA: decarboxylating 6-phosphogluconate dehydrogenase [bacterium]|nr:decarboxylating 6-phosphogluconate dehydrogenase [bacterium]